MFTAKDIVKIDRIYTLVKENGYTLEGAKKAMRSKEPLPVLDTSSNETSDLVSRLEAVKSKLIALKS